MAGVGTRESEGAERPPPAPAFGLSPLGWLLLPLVLVVPIFAHGCHTGDHDDEPALAPPAHRAHAPEPPK